MYTYILLVISMKKKSCMMLFNKNRITENDGGKRSNADQIHEEKIASSAVVINDHCYWAPPHHIIMIKITAVIILLAFVHFQ